MSERILIIGGGMGGLTAALALKKFGHDVTVFEQTDELKEVGAGLTVGPNATKVMNFIGLGDVLADKGDEPDRGCVLHYKTAEILHETQRNGSFEEQYGAKYYQIHRADLHDAMIQMMRADDPESLRLGHKVTRIDQDADSVTAHFDNGASATGGLLIAADGVRSLIRSEYFDAEPPTFTGQVAFRGLVDAKDVADHMTVSNSALTIGPAKTFTRYFLRHKTIVNYVAIARSDRWKEEGWWTPATLDELMEEYEGWNEDVLSIMRATPSGSLIKWGLFDRDPLSTWVQGRVALVGDAAHPMLPWMGMGASMAFEDALVCARAIEAGGVTPEAFQRYEAARKERADFVQIASRKQGAVYQDAHPDKFRNGGLPGEIRLNLFDYDAAQVSV